MHRALKCVLNKTIPCFHFHDGWPCLYRYFIRYASRSWRWVVFLWFVTRIESSYVVFALWDNTGNVLTRLPMNVMDSKPIARATTILFKYTLNNRHFGNYILTKLSLRKTHQSTLWCKLGLFDRWLYVLPQGAMVNTQVPMGANRWRKKPFAKIIRYRPTFSGSIMSASNAIVSHVIALHAHLLGRVVTNVHERGDTKILPPLYMNFVYIVSYHKST